MAIQQPGKFTGLVGRLRAQTKAVEVEPMFVNGENVPQVDEDVIYGVNNDTLMAEIQSHGQVCNTKGKNWI